MVKKSGVYKIICKSKVYIGSSINIDFRLNEHKRLLKNNKHYNKLFQRAYNKYGLINFKFEVIEIVDDPNKNKLIEREQYYLNTLLFAQEFIKGEDNRFEVLGFNIRATADSNLGSKRSIEVNKKSLETRINNGKLKHTEESKKNMSLIQLKRVKKNCPFCNLLRAVNVYDRHIISCEKKFLKPKRKVSDETKKKLSQFNLGKKDSEETKKRKSESLSGRKILWSDKISDSLKGVKKSKETVEKMKKAGLSKPNKECPFCKKEVKIVANNYNKHIEFCKNVKERRV